MNGVVLRHVCQLEFGSHRAAAAAPGARSLDADAAQLGSDLRRAEGRGGGHGGAAVPDVGVGEVREDHW
eukprot:11193722-Lingulodinium_polyedra.AAC.1